MIIIIIIIIIKSHQQHWSVLSGSTPSDRPTQMLQLFS